MHCPDRSRRGRTTGRVSFCRPISGDRGPFPAYRPATYCLTPRPPKNDGTGWRPRSIVPKKWRSVGGRTVAHGVPAGSSVFHSPAHGVPPGRGVSGNETNPISGRVPAELRAREPARKRRKGGTTGVRPVAPNEPNFGPGESVEGKGGGADGVTTVGWVETQLISARPNPTPHHVLRQSRSLGYSLRRAGRWNRRLRPRGHKAGGVMLERVRMDVVDTTDQSALYRQGCPGDGPCQPRVPASPRPAPAAPSPPGQAGAARSASVLHRRRGWPVSPG